jgi:hypothetical protein
MDGKTAEMVLEGQRTARKLGVPIYKFRELVLKPNSAREISTKSNETWLILECDTPISVRSDLGVHNRYSPNNPENVVLHEGIIKVENLTLRGHHSVQFMIAHWGEKV